MKRRKYHFNRNRFIVLTIIVVVAVFGYRYFYLSNPTNSSTNTNTTPVTLTTNNPIVKNSNSQLSPKPSLAIKSTQEISYVLLDPNTSTIIRSLNADTKRAPASTTKLLTALVVMKYLNETDIVKVGPEVEVEGSRLGLKLGDKISIHDLMTALLIHSSNDAAAALAVKVSGTIQAFASEMNKYASELNCTHTHFTNPHGMPDPEHYTTASDLLIISNEFLKNKELLKFVKENHATIDWKDAKGQAKRSNFVNTNILLGIYPGNQGLKTGTTTEAGECLISYVTRDDGDLLLVLLGSKQRYSDTIKLLDEGWSEQRANAAFNNLTKDPATLLSSPGIF